MPLPKIKTAEEKKTESLGETITVTCAVGTREGHTGYWCAGIHWPNGTSEKAVPVGRFYEFFLPHSRRHISVIKAPADFGDKVGPHLVNRTPNSAGGMDEAPKLDEAGMQAIHDFEDKLLAGLDPEVMEAQKRAAEAREAADKAQKEAEAAAKGKTGKSKKGSAEKPALVLTPEELDAQTNKVSTAPTLQEFVDAGYKREAYTEFVSQMNRESENRLKGVETAKPTT